MAAGWIETPLHDAACNDNSGTLIPAHTCMWPLSDAPPRMQSASSANKAHRWPHAFVYAGQYNLDTVVKSSTAQLAEVATGTKEAVESRDCFVHNS